MATVKYPKVNGVRFGWSSIELKLNGKPYVGVKSVNYSEKLEPTKIFGLAAQPIGRTRGEYSAEGSLEMYKAEAEALKDDLAGKGNGWGEVPFDVVIQFAEADEPPITVELIGCRIKASDNSASQGGDPLVEKYDLDIMYVITNGRRMVASPLAGAQA